MCFGLQSAVAHMRMWYLHIHVHVYAHSPGVRLAFHTNILTCLELLSFSSDYYSYPLSFADLSLQMLVVLQGSQKETLLRRHLCEDGGGDGGPSYMDLLCHIHKEIRNALA